MKINNVCVYGINESIKASKYPMSVDVETCTDEITERTKSLAQCATGTGHDNFLNGIIVQFDLTFSIKAWTEAERYNFFHFVSSQSTMHKISKMNISEHCNEYVHPGIISVVEDLRWQYNENPTPEGYLKLLYNVPVGFELTARMTTNYRQLKTIYQQRHNHRLPEWQKFCDWVLTLPRWKELMCNDA